jgi:micrococcal nuclease
MYKFKALVTKVVDGDTFDAIVDLGFHVSTKQRFRLMAVDTPEIFTPSCKEELEHGKQAKLFVENLILNKEIIIESHKIGAYNRWEANVTLQDGKNLSSVILAEGFAKKSNY